MLASIEIQRVLKWKPVQNVALGGISKSLWECSMHRLLAVQQVARLLRTNQGRYRSSVHPPLDTNNYCRDMSKQRKERMKKQSLVCSCIATSL
jgi:hypothetical protein